MFIVEPHSHIHIHLYSYPSLEYPSLRSCTLYCTLYNTSLVLLYNSLDRQCGLSRALIAPSLLHTAPYYPILLSVLVLTVTRGYLVLHWTVQYSEHLDWLGNEGKQSSVTNITELLYTHPQDRRIDKGSRWSTTKDYPIQVSMRSPPCHHAIQSLLI